MRSMLLLVLFGFCATLCAQHRYIYDYYEYDCEPPYRFTSVFSVESLSDEPAATVDFEIGEENDVELTDAIIARPGLRALRAGRSTLTDAQVKKLLQVETLEFLALVAIQPPGSLTDGALQGLPGCKKLKWLALIGNDALTNETATLVAKMPALESLEIGTSDGLGGDGLAALSGCINLHTLDLAFSKLSGPSFKAVCSLPKLRRLNISYIKGLSDSDVEYLTLAKNLEVLDANEIPGATAFKAIGQLSKLRILMLKSEVATDDLLTPLLSLKALEWLDLGYNFDLTDKFLTRLVELKALTRLNLTFTRITAEGLRALKGLKLVDLCVDGCDNLDDTTVDVLLEMESLLALNLSWATKITFEGVSRLTAHKHLQWLDLSWCKNITKAQASELAEKRKNLKIIITGLK